MVFQLGPLTVDPPTRRVSAADKSAMIEPRVMRVLIALSDAREAVLSRDDLIADCWDGLIVGDNAIARVISQLRRVVSDLAGDRVRIETIPRVGFRLIAEAWSLSEDEPYPALIRDHPPVAATPLALMRLSRRRVAVGGLGVAVGTGLYLWQARPFRHRPDPRARDLWARGQTILKNAEPGSTGTAMALYKQALAIDPDFAEAWGSLAIGYHHAYQGFSKEDRAAFSRLIESSARRALELDPEQPEAYLALALIKVKWGQWTQNLQIIQNVVRRFPDYWFANAKLGIMLREVGRIRESIYYSRRVLKIDPMLPIGWQFLALAQAMSGELQQADLTLDQAAARWPAHGALWWARMSILLASGRFDNAAAFARDPRSRPDYFPAGLETFYALLAEALRDGNKSQISRSIDGVLQKMADEHTDGRDYAPLLAVLGASNLALDSLEAFIAKANAAPETAVSPAAVVLFEPPILALRADPRFDHLLEASGLAAHWQWSGSQPTFVEADCPPKESAPPRSRTGAPTTQNSPATPARNALLPSPA